VTGLDVRRVRGARPQLQLLNSGLSTGFSVKTNSSKWAKTQGRAFVNFHWQSGYGGFSVSPADVEQVAEYIAQQETHHRAVTFQEEYRRLLESHGIEFDERDVWD